MPFDRPSIAEILARMQADYLAELPDADPYLPRSLIFAELAALSAAMHVMNGELEGIVRNSFLDQADEEELERGGELYGEPRLADAYGVGVFEYTGAEGTEVPEGTIHASASGLRYRSTSSPTVPSSGPVLCPVQALEKGAAYNLAAASQVDLEEPIVGINSGVGVVGSAGVTGGADREELETYRTRVLQRIRRRPQGGTLFDFERWIFESLSVPFTRVFVLPPASGSNLIQCYAVDDTLDVDGNNIARPTPAYAMATAYVTAAYRRPLCADFQLDPPAFIDLDLGVTLVPNTAAVQAAVNEEIIQLLIREATIAGAPALSHFDEAISRAAGETDHTITTAIPTVSAGELLRIGTTVFA